MTPIAAALSSPRARSIAIAAAIGVTTLAPPPSAWLEEISASRVVYADDVAGDRGRDPSRLSVTGSAVMFASYPMSVEDPGPAVTLSRPLWLGRRHRYFQWYAGATLLAGYGASSRHSHLAAGPQLGFDLYLGSVLGFEVRTGVAGLAQVGSRSVVGVGLLQSGGYVFRLWSDNRRRLKLVVTMQAGGYFASDPGNDVGMNASALGLGVAYEGPL